MADVNVNPAVAAPPAPIRNGGLSLSSWATIVSAVIASGILSGLGSVGNFLVLPLMDEFGVSRGAVLFWLALGGIAASLMLPLVGRVLVKTQPWTLMLTGVGLAGAALLGASAAQAFTIIIVLFISARALGAALCGGLVGQSIIVRRFPAILGKVVGAQTLMMTLTAIAVPLVVAPC